MARIGSVPRELSIGLLGSPSYNPLKGYRNRLRFHIYSKLGGALPHPFFQKGKQNGKSKRVFGSYRGSRF